MNVDGAGEQRAALNRALAVSIVLYALRWHVAQGAGFGDSEALYATWALFPQPAYLDHPGLVASLARWLGGGIAPQPAVAHTAANLIATATPWIAALAARALGASWARSLGAVPALALVPEIAIGLFALTPDLLLAPLWLGAIALAGLALSREARSFTALWATLGAGALVGLATLSKVSGALLGVALLAVWLGRGQRARFRSFAPWGALLLFAVLVAPVVLWEVRHDAPMLRHRLLSTQGGAALSLRNLSGLLGGQFAYVTPPFLWAAWLTFRELRRRRQEDVALRLAFLCVVVPALPLIVLCLWSRVAEPHWVAPLYLGLVVALPRLAPLGPRLVRASWLTGVAVVALAYVWVRTDLPARHLGRLYEPRWDLANDLYAWGPARELLDEAVDRAVVETGTLPIVIGPHWVVCAQAAAALNGRVAVGCNTRVGDDFDDWVPRRRWLAAPVLLYVTDSRFDVDPRLELPGRRLTAESHLDLMRGGRIIRTVTVVRLERGSELGRR